VIGRTLADRHQDARRGVNVVIFLALALGFDVSLDAVGDDPVRATPGAGKSGRSVRVRQSWIS
jgi:hypothetical protein